MTRPAHRKRPTPITADNAALTLALDGDSVWSIPATTTAPGSTLADLTVQDSLISFTPPPSPNAAFQQLVVHDYSGTDATIVLTADLGGQATGADRLVIDGGAARGSTGLLVHVVGGAGLTTGDGIMLVGTANGGETAADAFFLAGRVAGGAYHVRTRCRSVAAGGA